MNIMNIHFDDAEGQGSLDLFIREEVAGPLPQCDVESALDELSTVGSNGKLVVVQRDDNFYVYRLSRLDSPHLKRG